MDDRGPWKWRKYGEKNLKKQGRRSYSRCTAAGCTAKRYTTTCEGGQVQVTLVGTHNHAPPHAPRVRCPPPQGLMELADMAQAFEGAEALSTCAAIALDDGGSRGGIETAAPALPRTVAFVQSTCPSAAATPKEPGPSMPPPSAPAGAPAAPHTASPPSAVSSGQAAGPILFAFAPFIVFPAAGAASATVGAAGAWPAMPIFWLPCFPVLQQSPGQL